MHIIINEIMDDPFNVGLFWITSIWLMLAQDSRLDGRLLKKCDYHYET